MTRYLVRRLVGVLLVALIITAAAFVVFYLIPASPAKLSCGKPCVPTQLAAVKKFEGIDQPVGVQFFQYLKAIVVGRTYGSGGLSVHCSAPCFGYSFRQERPVLTLIMQRLPVTASIAVGAAVLWLVIGVALGVFSAIRRDSVLDRAALLVTLAGVAAPPFLIGLIGILVFGIWLNVLPVSGYVGLSDPAQWAFHLVLPWCTLALVYAAWYARLTRTQMLDVLAEDYITVAVAKGVPRRRIIGRHALRAVIPPVLVIFGVDLGSLLGGAVITENVFGMQGLGHLLLDAVHSADLPVVVGCTVFSGVLVVLANLVVDIVHAALDPRVTYS
ncbi:MAG TPA: ABC transporter permease [Jatrophihabitantaceae bacterium]|nr:ABC transporter permease [Jatrophihabitantaceae bacterium]